MRSSWRSPRWCSVACCTLLMLAACDKDKDSTPKDKATDKGKAKGGSPDAKKDGDEVESLVVADADEGGAGPVPPQESMVFFTVEGALYPLGCYDKASKAMTGGKGCREMVKTGDKVRVASHDSQYNKVAGEPTVPQCLAGSGKKIGIGVEGITEGADFKYAAWPPSTLKAVHEVDPESTQPAAITLDDEDKAKLFAAIKSNWSGAKGEVQAHQVAQIDADGQGKKDTVYSVFLPHPKLAEQYLWSGAFLALEGNLDAPILLEKSKSKRDVFEVRGWLNLDGAGSNELWMRMVFEESTGDHLLNISSGKAVALSRFSCKVER